MARAEPDAASAEALRRPSTSERAAAGAGTAARPAPGEATARQEPGAPPKGKDKGGEGQRRVRRTRLVVRKIDPWSVLKFSLVFYFCVMLILLFATAVIFAVMKLLGVFENIEQLFRSLELDVTISGGGVFKWFFLLGILGTIVATAVTVLMTFLYNLIADVVGGVEISLSEPK